MKLQILALKDNIIFGCAGIGQDYGINNRKRNSFKESLKLLTHAYNKDLKTYDTARAYGKSESFLGKCFHAKQDIKIISKLDPNICSIVEKDTIEKKVLERRFFHSIESTLKNLQTNSIDSLLLHRAFHVELCDGYLLKLLNDLIQQGIIQKYGVSVQNRAELDLIMAFKKINIIQLPFNIAENRWNNYFQEFDYLAKKNGTEFHCRSIFLQGLLLSEVIEPWKKLNAEGYFYPFFSFVRKALELTNAKDLNSLLLNFVLSHSWVNSVVVGLDSEMQINELLDTQKLEEYDLKILKKIYELRPTFPNILLDPSQWEQRR